MIHFLRRLLFWPRCQKPFPWTGEHSFVETAEFKRECTACGREEWVMQKQYPRIGEASLTWELIRDPLPEDHAHRQFDRWVRRRMKKSA